MDEEGKNQDEATKSSENKSVENLKAENEAENGENQPDDDDKHLVRRHSLDPKVIKSLENDLMRAMIGLDLPESLQQQTSTDAQESSRTTATQFTMESFKVTPPTNLPAEITPSTVQSQNPTQQAPQIGWCDGCCSVIPIRTAPSRIGPMSAYSIKNKCSELLPPKSPEDSKKITLVLDLDETLVHSSFMAIPHSDFSFVLGLDANKLGVYVCIRPGAEEFLLALGELYELVLFTASSQYYADTVVDHIDPERKIKYRLYRESCTDFSGCFVKDLSKLGRDLKKIIIVDNSSVAYLLHPYNAISVTSWYDDPADNELIDIQKFLISNCHAENVYDILCDQQ